jgi:probable F420-dependent oxidoreductase
VKFGIIYNPGQLGMDPSRIIAVARHAEDCGLESFYLPEHIALYPGATLYAHPVPPDLPLADPLSTLSFVAAATRRILLGTSVLLLPFHHPVVLAKELATIDVLSGGRMRLLTVGLGVLPGEAEAVGVDFGTRGRRADEAIDVLRLLWAGGADGVSFEGEFFSFASLTSFPKPSARPRSRSTWAGRAAPAAGYFPGGGLSAAERARQVELMRETPARRAGTPRRWSTPAGVDGPVRGGRQGPGRAAGTRGSCRRRRPAWTSSAGRCPRSRRGSG